MQHFSPKMPFKGKRCYLHGTSILEYAMQLVKQQMPSAYGGRLRAAFHGFAKTELSVIFSSEEEIALRPEEITAEVISQGISGERVFIWFTESGVPITMSVPYPEELLAPQLVYAERNVVFEGETPFSPVETLVAMTKFFHLRLMPDVESWIFTRLDIVRPLLDVDLNGLSVELQHQFGTLSRSRICSRSGELGMIYFSAIEK